MNVFNPAQFRAQFPALQDAGVYLDSAATALKPVTLNNSGVSNNIAHLKCFGILNLLGDYQIAGSEARRFAGIH